MPTFPLPFRPEHSYHTGGRKFGAEREDGARKHAGCDLIAPVGTAIYAVEDGELVRAPYRFYHGTDAIDFKLAASGRIVRYCEIKEPAPGVQVGTKLKEGDVIAFVGKMYRSSMLHFEMYEGATTGPLTNRSNPPFQRRKDLMNPTEYLDSCTMWDVLAARKVVQSVDSAVQSLVKSIVPVRWL